MLNRGTCRSLTHPIVNRMGWECQFGYRWFYKLALFPHPQHWHCNEGVCCLWRSDCPQWNGGCLWASSMIDNDFWIIILMLFDAMNCCIWFYTSLVDNNLVTPLCTTTLSQFLTLLMFVLIHCNYTTAINCMVCIVRMFCEWFLKWAYLSILLEENLKMQFLWSLFFWKYA